MEIIKAMNYKCEVFGRKLGAIGLSHKFLLNTTIKGVDHSEEKVRLNCYEKANHIERFKIIESKEVNIIEGVEENFNDAIKGIETFYKSIVPLGYFKVSNSCFKSSRTKFLHFGMIEKKEDCNHGYRENDAARGLFTLDVVKNKKGIIELVLTREIHALSCLPDKQFLAMSHKSVPFRKMRAKTGAEMARKFNKYMLKFVEMVREEIKNDNLYFRDLKEKYKTQFNNEAV